MTLENPLFEVLLQMRLRGGSFVCQLARCMDLADSENLAKLQAAFPEILQTYDGFASLEAREAERIRARQLATD